MMPFSPIRPLLPVLAVMLLFSPAAASAEDSLEAYDNAMLVCMDEAMPGYSKTVLKHKTQEEALEQYQLLTSKMGQMTKCMQDKGFIPSDLNDFSMYMDEATEEIKKGNEEAVLNDPRLKDPEAGSAVVRQTGDGDETPAKSSAPPVYVAPDNNKKNEKTKGMPLYVPQ